jgi:hypothetical protein
MNKFVAVSEDGTFMYTASFADDNMVKNGQKMANGATMMAVPLDIDDTVLLSSFCFENGVLVTRRQNPASYEDGKLVGLPTPCTIKINGSEYPCNVSEAELGFTYPGDYYVEVVAPGHFPKRLKIVA